MPSTRETRTTTVRLPAAIYEQARRVFERERKRGSANSSSFNDLVVTAITAYLKMYRRKQIDAAFAGMAEDAGYREEAQRLAEEFADSDWEALGVEERSGSTPRL